MRRAVDPKLVDQLERARQYAQKLDAEWTPQKANQARNLVVQKFFAETGVPPAIKEGWARLEQWREQRKGVGFPLPPGGCIMLGREAVIAGAMADMHAGLGALLGMPLSAIKLRLQRTETGKVVPVADIAPPKDWVMPVSRLDTQNPQEAARDFFAAAQQKMALWFSQEVLRRLAICERRRVLDRD